jgi:hydrogenase nickel incorporation protein HypA/HybF
MHETSIAAALLDQLLRIAAEHHATRIEQVEVRCGVMRQVVPEALQLAFEAASAGTPAAGAQLTIIEEGLVVRCRACRAEFASGLDDYRCPRCKTADVELIAGHDIILRSVVCQANTAGSDARGPDCL